MKTIDQVNSQKVPEVTYAELKTFKGFENLTEAEAEKELIVINKIARIMYFLYVNEHEPNNKQIE